MARHGAFFHLWPGVPLALGAALLFGLTAPLSKLLLGQFDPQFLAGVLYLGSCLGLAFFNGAGARSACPRRRRRCGGPTCSGSRRSWSRAASLRLCC
jgi:hypothetical protein